MKTIKMYSASAQSDSGYNDKGTPSNPYTQDEFDSMLAAGTWSGGLMRSTNKCTGSTHYYILTSIRENK